jgi:hypothetical protein
LAFKAKDWELGTASLEEGMCHLGRKVPSAGLFLEVQEFFSVFLSFQIF